MSTLTVGTEDYRRVEVAIRYLEENYRDQPSLAALADHVGLSEFHFQRLFKRWAGISPKRFLQFLTAEHAKEGLRRSRTVLDAAMDVGLSGPGRLHDLLGQTTAVTPGEFKLRGQGLELSWGFVESPFGPCLVAMTERGVCDMSFHDEPTDTTATAVLEERWPGASLTADPTGIESRAEGLFARAPGRPLPLDVRGTNLQIQVWKALLTLPSGAVATYGDVARAAGRPTAIRAAASAVAGNRIAWLIPCHRVIRKSGETGQYRWGPLRKRAMLVWEAAGHPSSQE